VSTILHIERPEGCCHFLMILTALQFAKGLARCIIKTPQLILLDEATSALDSSTEKEIQNNIVSLCRGRTTIMIAHRFSTARNADEILVLEMGNIIERGSHSDLLENNGRYAEMWRIQTNTDDE